MKILITGATGFIGGALAKKLAAAGHTLVTPVRTSNPDLEKIASVTKIDSIDGDTDWRKALAGVQIVIHTAAHVHVINPCDDDLERFHTINVLGTGNLAKQAAEAGVKRFIFISSVAVNDICVKDANHIFTADDPPRPTSLYGLSKYEAEQALQKIAHTTGMEAVILRPPLVYGKGSRGSFSALVKLIKLGIPLPFGALKEKQSLVGIDNLMDLIALCLTHEKAANQIFLAADAETLSTTEIIQTVARALGKKVILLPFPKKLLKLMLCTAGRQALVGRIFEPLVIDISKNKIRLGWTPKLTTAKGIELALKE
jgi:UDP-glucose 4-epimerase